MHQSHSEGQHRLRASRTLAVPFSGVLLSALLTPVPQGVGGTILWTCHEIYTGYFWGTEYMGIACACLCAMSANISEAKFSGIRLMESTDIFCFTVYCALCEGASKGLAVHST